MPGVIAYLKSLTGNAGGAALDIEGAAVRTSYDFMQMTREFFRMQASGGIVLVVAALSALVLANTPLYEYYDFVLNKVDFRIGFDAHVHEFDQEIKKPILLWINDGLMALFFFLVGLEIKREVLDGRLADIRSALLPVCAAIGGILCPAGVYWLLNGDNPSTLPGWAIPAATDIAFALGVLSLAGSRAPISLKIMLTAIAIIDDIAAILIIAFFYSHGITVFPLYFAALALIGLLVLNRTGVVHIASYVLLGIVLWVSLLESGIHATIAGVIAAMFIPLSSRKNPEFSPLRHLEHSLHPWVAFGILPLFAFANAGVPLDGFGIEGLSDPVTVGIALGLFAGKQLGVFSVIFIAVRLGLAGMPEGAGWIQLYAVSVLCGIGFTMSLFIGGLAFDGMEMQAAVRVGVLIGSFASAALGYFLLSAGNAGPKRPPP